MKPPRRPMKDSGLKWVGQIPAGWETSKIAYLVRYSKGLNITKSDLVSNGTPVISYGQIHAKTNDGVHLRDHLLRFVPANMAEGHPASRLAEGDFVFADTSEDYDGVGNCVRVDRTDEIYAGYHTLIARPYNKENSHYLSYLFRCDPWRSQLRMKAIGTKVFTISQKMLLGVSVLLPPLPEQRAIAARLDELTGRIESESKKIAAEIERLEQYKKSFITEAVCGRFDFNAEEQRSRDGAVSMKPPRPMKDSGIPWVGKIPEEWGVSKGKYILKLLNRPIRDDDGVITCFRDGEVTLRSKRREAGFTISLKECGYQGIDPGDLVVHGMDGFAGSIGISDSRGKATPVLNVLDSTQDKRYLMYYLRGLAYRNVFVALATGIRVRSCDLRWNKLSNLMYVLPPLAEQRSIAAAIDATCAKVDAIVAKRKRQLDRLDALKRSLVYEYVTGKKEVKVERV